MSWCSKLTFTRCQCHAPGLLSLQNWITLKSLSSIHSQLYFVIAAKKEGETPGFVTEIGGQ